MKHEFTVAGPIRVQATLRATDLVVAEGAADTVTVLLESSRDASDRGAFVASTVVELVGGVLHLEAPLPRFFSRERTRIRVTLPPGSEIDVGTGSGDITCTVPLSRAVVRSGSGDIHLVEVGDLVAVTGSGDVRVTTVGRGRAQTGSGDIWAGAVRDSLVTRTGSGDVTVASTGRLQSTSGSGDITVDELHGQARLRTASGDAHVARAVSGHLDVKSTSGDVRVGVAQGTAVLLDCSTVSGQMRSALRSTGEPEPGEETLELVARTISGNLLVDRAG